MAVASAAGRRPASMSRAPTGRTAQLSIAAVAHGHRLLPLGRARLADALYRYNTSPLSPRWRARLGAPGAVEHYLGTAGLARSRAFTRHGWDRDAPAAAAPWISWRRPRYFSVRPGDERPVFKLYVSPHVNDTRDAFNVAARCVLDSEALAMKVGRGARGLLRPDKLVAYFADRGTMLDVADVLAGRLAGVRAQGVPFTAGLTPDGLLSCGVDRPTVRGGVIQAESWRLRMSRRLAASLLAEARRGRRRDDRAPVAARAVLATLARDGINLLDDDGRQAVAKFAAAL